MTTMRTSPHDAVRDASRHLGLPPGPVTPLRSHATHVYLLPDQQTVARVRPLTDAPASARTTTLLHWLHAHGFPATQPLADPVEDPASGYIVTFWTHYPQPPIPPPAAALGTLLNALHALPHPPVTLPQYEPLAHLRDSLDRTTTLTTRQRTWLTTAVDEAVHAYRALDSPLGHGLIHGDAYPGNTLWDGDLVRLGDWDEAATGPRELDLANTLQGAVRFGRTEREINEFLDAYGHDPRPWPGLRVLTRMRDLHTLGSFIRRADRGDDRATHELTHRLHTLQTGHHNARWGIH
ncbi:phosphotransferase family protein [Streptomyces sp. NPDC059247]|uniref:phosphotransferase family protein n=1 Tax=Streptomyces sp. NPDC059247 TaxID=3346790 RepID=UPI0036A36301